ncbi:hypothetical protein DBR47_01840 [Paucibacter sp. KBW04]|nr:hypothetical protein DBR47_01840 [Paucibacter sp. KBW04]
MGSAALLGGLLFSPLNSSAMELGRPQTLSGLGEALSLKLPMRLSPGETLNADCIKVTIETADQVLPAHQVHKTVDYQAESHSGWVWVKTTVAIEEPVVKLSLGCPTQQLTAFVDPAPAAAAKAQTAAAVSSSSNAMAIKAAATQAKLPATAATANPAAPVAKAPARVTVLILGPDRLRFDLDGGSAGRPGKSAGAWQKDGLDPARAGFGLLMSLDPGRAPAAAAAAPSASGAGLGQRVQAAESEFQSLQNEHASLSQELDKLTRSLAERRTQSSPGPAALLALAAALLGLAGLSYFVLWPRWRLRSRA